MSLPIASASPEPRLYTPRFFVMCGFSFTVFLSAFQLLPTAPFHIRELGGGAVASGLFLGLLTYASAFSAPITGMLGDRTGHTRQLFVCGLIVAFFSMAYAVAPTVWLLLILVPLHGIAWSGLLSASAAYMLNLLPPDRRAEGIGVWGLSTVLAVAVAPPVGFWMYRYGWTWLCLEATVLNLTMAWIARRLERSPAAPQAESRTPPRRRWIEWRVLGLSLPLFLYSYSYGAITSFSAVYAEALRISPKSIYLTALALVILLTRPLLGPLGDRFGYRRVFVPCLAFITAGLILLTLSGSRSDLVVSAIVFGIGFGTAYTVFAAYVTHGVGPDRRGAVFGAILAAFDTGIGTGSTLSGWIIGRAGFGAAFGTAAALSALAIPAFLILDRRLGTRRERS
jgi:MFS family permease